MVDPLDRRSFLKLTAAAASGGTLSQLVFPDAALAGTLRQDRPIRLGFVGIGGRGSYHLDCALGIPGVEVPAISELRPDRLQRAKEWIEQSGRPTPTMYDRERDFERMAAEIELDAIICATSWEWHAPVCLAAMRHEKHAVSEVPIILTVEEAWELVETYERTGKWATLALEQVLLESGAGQNLALLNLVHAGVLGDIRHAEGGYVHDLRRVQHDYEGEPWRLWHSIHRNGNLYPDHPMNRIMPYLDINHGDRFDFLVSLSSRSGTLNEYAREIYGPEHPEVTMPMKQGDFNATLIRTRNGKLVTLNFDTSTPHPRESFRLQGTKGVYFEPRVAPAQIYLDRVSPESDRFEPAKPYLDRHPHPLIEGYDPPERPTLRGHGGGGQQKTPLTWHLLIEALRRDRMPYFDVYDSVTSSVISPLSEASVAANGRPVDVPDFTRGRWTQRPPLTLHELATLV